MDEIYLKDLRHESGNGECICEWEFLQINNDKVRIYYKVNKDKGNGFLFYAVENAGHVCVPETEKDRWHKDYCIVECVIWGTAYYDGIRHLYYGHETTLNFGYHYYPDLELISSAILGLRELENKYCAHKDD